jgi:hypothetical protein
MKLNLKRTVDGCGAEEIITYTCQETGAYISKLTSWDNGSVLDCWEGKRNNESSTAWGVEKRVSKENANSYDMYFIFAKFSKFSDAKKYFKENFEKIKSIR